GRASSTPAIGIEHFIPITFFIFASERLRCHQMMQTVLVQHQNARCFYRLLVDIFVLRIVSLMINTQVEGTLAVDFAKTMSTIYTVKIVIGLELLLLGLLDEYSDLRSARQMRQ